jgi:RasGEF N-terminal motif
MDHSTSIAQLPMTQTSQVQQSLSQTSIRKRRFKQLRRAMSLNYIRHKATPPHTAPPTPTVPRQVPSSSEIKSLGSLTNWQLPDPTGLTPILARDFLAWPSGLPYEQLSSKALYEPSLGQLSPPPSIPSESDIFSRESLLGIQRGRFSQGLSASPHTSASQTPHQLYPAVIYDVLDLSDDAVLEKDKTGKVIAGTIEGLVAYITSPDCLDYDVLSDFFMMYRTFLDPCRLLGLLCARFEWGLIHGGVVIPPDNEGNWPRCLNDCRYGSSTDFCCITALAVELFQ